MPKSRDPYIKWWPSDFMASIDLRKESFEIQGLWLNLFNIMQHSGEPFGHLALKGKKISVGDLTILCLKTDEKNVEILLKQIIEKGLFDVTPDGILFCRRLLRDKRLKEIRTKAGKKGGDSTKSKVLLEQTCEAKRGNGNGNGNGNETIEKESKKPVRKPPPEIPEWALEIRQYWNEWRASRGLNSCQTASQSGQGVKNLLKLAKAPDEVAPDTLSRCSYRYLTTVKDAQFICAFANFWGKQRRFEAFLPDDWTLPTTGSGTTKPTPTAPQQAETPLQKFFKSLPTEQTMSLRRTIDDPTDRQEYIEGLLATGEDHARKVIQEQHEAFMKECQEIDQKETGNEQNA